MEPGEERNWAMAAHLSALIAVAGLPFGHVIGPLVVYLAKGKDSAFVSQHARASLNYQITASIAGIVAVVVGLVLFAIVAAVTVASSPHGEAASTSAGVTFVVLWALIIVAVVALLIASLVFIIMGTMAASAGKPYQYPFAIQFVR
jgi:uncharacterized Tic20 family protein